MKYCHDSSFQIHNAGSFWTGNFWLKHSNHLKPFSTATENCRIRGFSAALVEANRFNTDGILFVSSEEQRTQQDNLRIAPWLRWRLRFFEAWLRMILYHTLPAHPKFGRLFFWASWKLKPRYFRTNIFSFSWIDTVERCWMHHRSCSRVVSLWPRSCKSYKPWLTRQGFLMSRLCRYIKPCANMNHGKQWAIGINIILLHHSCFLQSECWVDACLTKSE